MRTVALDVHKRSAEVAVHEDGQVRRLGRVETKDLKAFAGSLGPADHVVLESTSMTWTRRHIQRSAPRDHCAFHARVKARRGTQVALCATARKLTVLAWQLLSKGEDYRYGAPTVKGLCRRRRSSARMDRLG